MSKNLIIYYSRKGKNYVNGSFIESYDFSGRTVIPFCTHAGSGLSRTVQTLRDKL